MNNAANWGATGAELYGTYHEELGRAQDELGKVNIVIAGNAGVGKSTLINAVFGKKVATTGVGDPQTQGIEKHEFSDRPFRIYDTRGFEIKNAEKTVGDVRDHIDLLRRQTDPNDQIHIAWLCILEQSHRIEPIHVSFLEMLRAQTVKRVVVITQAFGDEEMHDKVHELAVPNDAVVPTLAMEKRIGPHHIPAHGVGELVEATLKLLPDAQRAAFIAAQTARWDIKETAAIKEINIAAGLALASAAIPVPGGHSVALLSIQVGLVARINARIGISLGDSGGAELMKGMFGIVLARMGGQTAFAFTMAEVARLFPGVGWLGAAAVGGPIGSAFTKIFGHLYLDSVKGYAQTNDALPPPADLMERMKRLLEQHRDHYRRVGEAPDPS